jgi:hypothetical protein
LFWQRKLGRAALTVAILVLFVFGLALTAFLRLLLLLTGLTALLALSVLTGLTALLALSRLTALLPFSFQIVCHE